MLAYQRVYKQILQALKDNTYPIGSLLPAEPELEKIYGVSRTTVRRAIAQLAEEGYVKVKQGHGTIVLKSIYPTDAFEYSRLHHFEDILSIRHVNIPNPEQMSARGMYIDSVASDETISQVLEIPVGTMVYRIQRIFYSGDNPLMFLNNYLRMDFFRISTVGQSNFGIYTRFWFSIITFSIRDVPNIFLPYPRIWWMRRFSISIRVYPC